MPRKDNKEIIIDKIIELEDEYDHYRTVDKERANYIYTDIGVYREILNDIERLEQLEKENYRLVTKIKNKIDQLNGAIKGASYNGNDHQVFILNCIVEILKEVLEW